MPELTDNDYQELAIQAVESKKKQELPETCNMYIDLIKAVRFGIASLISWKK